MLEKSVIHVDFFFYKKSVSKARNSNGKEIMNWEKGKICKAVTVASIGQRTAETWVKMIVSGPLVITARRALSLRNEGLSNLLYFILRKGIKSSFHDAWQSREG